MVANRKAAYAATLILTVGVVLAELWGAHPKLLFYLAVPSLVGLAWFFGKTTYSVDCHVGRRAGAVLSATMGNFAAIITPVLALWAGLTEVAKASIIGAVIGDILLVFGASILLGSLKNGLQSFSAEIAQAHAAMLGIVATALLLPTIFTSTAPVNDSRSVQYLSGGVALVMLTIYSLYLIYYFKAPEQLDYSSERPPLLSKVTSFLLLGGTVLVMTYVADIFVEGIKALTHLKEANKGLFVGMILVPLVGNVAEHIGDVEAAYKNEMDFSLSSCLGASIQMMFLMPPILIILGFLMGQPFDLAFDYLSIGSLVASVVIIMIIALHGRCNWLQGAMLCSVYLITAFAFYSYT